MTENASAIESAIQSEMGFRRLVARTLMEVSQLVAELVVSLSNKGQGVTRKRLGPIGELEPQPELDVAKKLVNAGGIDRREKILKQWVDSYIARWAAELEQVKAERDRLKKTVELMDLAVSVVPVDQPDCPSCNRVQELAEAALGEKGK